MANPELWQRTLNQQTAGNYASFAGHRQHVTSLLGGRARGLRLCLLGAGNCNDVDLVALHSRFREIVLVDIDANSLTSAVMRQPIEVRSALTVRAPLDFSGLERIIDGSGEHAMTGSALASELATAIDPEPFDIVGSACVLSQLIDQVRARVSDESDHCVHAVQMVRETHIALMLRLLRAGGRGVLVSDMVSSDTVPELSSAEPADLPVLMTRLVAERNFFTGLNPFVIERLLKEDPGLAPSVARSAFHSPWIWQLGPTRAYLTFAISFQRA